MLGAAITLRYLIVVIHVSTIVGGGGSIRALDSSPPPPPASSGNGGGDGGGSNGNDIERTLIDDSGSKLDGGNENNDNYINLDTYNLDDYSQPDDVSDNNDNDSDNDNGNGNDTQPTGEPPLIQRRQRQRQRQQQQQQQHEPMADVIAVKEGADLDLSCPIVVHNDDMIISWMCDNEPANLRSSRIHVIDSGKLRIRSAKVGDSCNYRCEAADGFGTLSVVIKVIIVDKRLVDQLNRRQQERQEHAISTGPGSHSRHGSAADSDSHSDDNYLKQQQRAAAAAATSAPSTVNSTRASQSNSRRKLQTASAPFGYTSSSSSSLPASAYNQSRQQPKLQRQPLGDDQVSGPWARNAMVPVQPRQLLQPLQQQLTSVHNTNTNSAAGHSPENGSAATQLPGVVPTGGTGTNHAASGNPIAPISASALEVVIEPANVTIGKNKSFSLECRVRYQPNFRAPQILWLKESVGRKPGSIVEQLEQNLILIDQVYYYTLNWPRSITYSHLFATTNSALLIRHSSFVHSGRYICFAGYPPSLMHPSDLTMAAAAASTDNITSDSKVTSNQEHHHSLAGESQRPQQTRPLALKYKMAQATVHVDDPVNELEYKTKMLGKQEQPPQSYLRAIVSSITSGNFWIRNLTVILLMICIVLITIKLACNRKQIVLTACLPGRKNNRQKQRQQISQPPEATSVTMTKTVTATSSGPTVSRPLPAEIKPSDTGVIQVPPPPARPRENIIGSRGLFSMKQKPARLNLISSPQGKPRRSRSIIDTDWETDITHSLLAKLNLAAKSIERKEQNHPPPAPRQIDCAIDSVGNSYGDDCNNDRDSHLYSEIACSKDDTTKQSTVASLTVSETISSSGDDHYKRPKLPAQNRDQDPRDGN